MSEYASDRSGLIMIERNLFKDGHPLFEKEARFSEREAWIWMIAEAAWKPRRVKTPSGLVNLERGQLTAAVRFMAEKFGWSKSKTHRFISRLESETMIGTDSGTGQLVITICNYSKYQDFDEYRGTAAGQRVGHERDSSGTAAGQTRTPDNTREYKDDDSGRDENEKWIIEDGATWLLSRGYTDTQVPRLINDWLKAHDAKLVRDAIAQSQTAMAGNPVAYIAKVLKNGPRSNLQVFPNDRKAAKAADEQRRKDAYQAELDAIRNAKPEGGSNVG